MEKILFIGDIHIKFNNFKEIELLEEKIQKLDFLITFIVIAGDVLDTHEKINTQLLNKAYNFIKICREKAPVYILVGNHDYINNQQFLTTNHWMNGLKEWKDVFIVDKPVFYKDESNRSGPKGLYVFMPYVPVGRFVEALTTITLYDWKQATCIFAHQEIKNCKMGPIQSIEGDEWDLNWPMLISGHIHERQSVQKNVLYPGSVINHSFGSDNQGLSIFSFWPSFSEIKIDTGFEKKSIIYENINTKINLNSITKNNKLSLEGELKDIAAFKKTKIYKSLIDKQIKVVFRIKQPERPQEPDTTQPDTTQPDTTQLDTTQPNTTRLIQESRSKNATTPFATIISNLIIKESNRDLEKDFELIKKF
jgi:DNA repair exonuclease SbcCD nuclease subunit